MHPQGGLARRASYVNAFREKFKDDIPALHVDVGHLFTDEFDINQQEKLREDAMVMNNWMLKGFSQYRLDVANLSYRDLRYSSVMFDKGKFEENLKASPLIGDMVSANIIPAVDLNKTTAPKPYIIREVKGNRFNKTFKVGFIGLTQPGPGEKTGFVVEDPLNKIKAILPEVRQQVDLVVVLAYLPLEMTKKMVQENPGIDIVIAANGTPMPPLAQREGNTVIVYSVNQTKSLGELRLYTDQQGKVIDYLNRYIVLDTAIPDIPEAAKINEASKTEIAAAKAKADAAEAKASGPNLNADQPKVQVTDPAKQPNSPPAPTSKTPGF